MASYPQGDIYSSNSRNYDKLYEANNTGQP